MNARAGDTFVRVLTWTSQADGTPISLAGATVEWSLKNGETEHSYSTAPQVAITDAAAGEITLTLSPEETRAMRQTDLLRKWWYEVTVTLADTSRVTILEGSIRMRDEVLNEP
jgi:hypothetical protein